MAKRGSTNYITLPDVTEQILTLIKQQNLLTFQST